MSDLLSAIERAERTMAADGKSPSLESFVAYRDRRRRHQQMAAGARALLLLAAVIAGAAALLRFSDQRMPADRNQPPPPASSEPVRPPTLPPRFNVAGAWGEMDGVRWAIWTNDDLSLLGFTSGAGGDYSGTDQEYETPYDGSDLKVAGMCAYSCPVPERPIIFGVVSGRVARVDFVLDDGTTYPSTVHPAPEGLSVDARIFTVPIDRRGGTFTGTLTATAAGGSVLAEIRYPWRADTAGGWSMPMSVEATLASGVPLSTVDGRPSEADRWEIAIWRNAAGEWCFGTIYPIDGSAVVASDEPGCGRREELFGRSGLPIDHADVWSIDEASMFGENPRWLRYRVVGTTSADVAAVRIEVEDGQVIEAELYDPPTAFADMSRLFVAEFRWKDRSAAYQGTGRISWSAIALDANGDVLGSDEMSM